MDIGIDFGSTYSVLSRFRPDHQVLEALEESGSTAIPSVVSQKNDKVGFGTYAKNLTGRNGISTYKAFKMLLMEQDKALLRSRGYDPVHSPKWVTQMFLGNMAALAQKTFGDASIDHLVVGAPDVWFHNFETISGRKLLESICASIDGVDKDNVRIVSEPVLASAYFAYNFQRQTQSPFEGVILIVDYGGGTLDLSLSEIRHGAGMSIEVKSIASRGAGENTDRSIGNAGIVYMESLMEYVIRKYTPEKADALIGTAAFYRAVNELEQELKHGHDTGEIKEIYGGETGQLDYPDDFEDDYLELPVSCGGEEYDISFEDMLIVYNQVIRDVFDKTMDSIIEDASQAGIDVFKANGDKFKIALVGGFGNFWLVHKQMQEKFHFTSSDDREKNIIVNEQDRERAISYGAALVASGTFSIRKTAPYSIGMCSQLGGQTVTDYMVRHFDEIEPGQPYYIKEKNGDIKIFSLGAGWADEFVIDESRSDEAQGSSSYDTKFRFRAKDTFQKKLQGIVKNPFKTCGIGISFTESDVLQLHIKEYFYMEERFSETDTVVELGQLKETFEVIA